jgi:hypothetical protein
LCAIGVTWFVSKTPASLDADKVDLIFLFNFKLSLFFAFSSKESNSSFNSAGALPRHFDTQCARKSLTKLVIDVDFLPEHLARQSLHSNFLFPPVALIIHKNLTTGCAGPGAISAGITGSVHSQQLQR